MRAIDVRGVPDEVYTAVVKAAEGNDQSLSAYVIDVLVDAVRVANYIVLYEPPLGSRISLEDAARAVGSARAEP